MQVKDIMTQSVECIDRYASLREAARKMEHEDIGFLPVIENGELVGVLTDRDITVRAVSRGLDPEETTVEETMTLDIVSLRETSELEDASDLMQQRHVRRLVITDDDDVPVGVVSMDKVALYLGPYATDRLSVRDTHEFPPDFEPGVTTSVAGSGVSRTGETNSASTFDAARDTSIETDTTSVPGWRTENEPQHNGRDQESDTQTDYEPGVRRGPAQPPVENDVAKRAFEAEPWRRSG
ncbi:MAG: CBS domain-containing protein [Burkholderiales bacterium]